MGPSQFEELREPPGRTTIAVSSPAVCDYHHGLSRLCASTAIGLLPITAILVLIELAFDGTPTPDGLVWRKVLASTAVHYVLPLSGATAILSVFTRLLPWPPSRAAELWFGPEGVLVRRGSRTRRIPARSIRSGLEIPSAHGGSRIELYTAGGRVVRVDFADVRAARRALSALTANAARSAMSRKR